MNLTMRVKSFIQTIANRFGYEIRRLPAPDEQKAVAQLPPVGEYTYYYPWGYQTYSPWWQDWFQKIMDKVRGTTLVSDDRCYIIYTLCLNCVHLQGDFAECGTYKGGTAFLIANIIKESTGDRQLHLFDTFTGMPNMVVGEIDYHQAGSFADTSLDSVRRYLSQFPFTVFHPGLIPDTLSGVKDKLFSFVHVDVDIYQSARHCCEFFYQRLVKGGVMVFDDYGFIECKGERKAVDEFFMDKRENPVVLPTGQCLVIKL
jgi:O-methyltransferase